MLFVMWLCRCSFTIKVVSISPSLESEPALWLVLASKMQWYWGCATFECRTQEANMFPLTLSNLCHYCENMPGLAYCRMGDRWQLRSAESQLTPTPTAPTHVSEPSKDQQSCLSDRSREMGNKYFLLYATGILWLLHSIVMATDNWYSLQTDSKRGTHSVEQEQQCSRI